MRPWSFWWNTLVLASQHNPPQFIELLMLLLALILLGIWSFTPNWAYQVLAWSYLVGVSASMWVREAIAPTHQKRATQIAALLLLLISIYGFADLIYYL
jgi:hypothetical protein